MIHPHKKHRHLAQHFLNNKTALQKIAAALKLQTGETVIEIGAGHGELTEELLRYPVRVIAVEKDRILVRLLQQLEIKNSKFKIVSGDILPILPQLNYQLKAISYKLVGNIPYYLTGRLLRLIGELENKPSLMVLTLQKEVAERLCAGAPRMNLLAASVQVWADPKILAILPPTDFNPPPAVESAIVKFVMKGTSLTPIELTNYYRLIKIIFRQPRQTILNNLANGGLAATKKECIKKLAALNLTGRERGQNLSLSSLITLTRLFPNTS